MTDKGSFSSLRQLSDCTQRTNNFYHSQSHFLYFSIFMVVPMKFISHLFTARIFKTHLLLKRSIIKSKLSVEFRVYGHTTENGPLLVRSPKLTSVGLFFYLYGCSNEVYFTFFHSSSFQNTLASQTLYYKVQGVRSISCLRPHHRERTGSRQITEVNLGRASIVLGWVTAWEQLVLQTFFFFLAENFGEYAMIDKGSFSSLRQLSDCTQRTNNFYHSQ